MASFNTMPDDVLRELFDYIPPADRLRVLAVNTRCRAVGMDHPFYWQRLSVNMDAVRETALQGAIDHFFTRLTHAGQRPVQISLRWSDPRRVVDRILSHISHIVFLQFLNVDMRVGQAVLDALNHSAAPILRDLILNFDGALDVVPMMEPRPCLGSNLFQSNAPFLKRLDLTNIDFPAEFPKALGALIALKNKVLRGPIQEVPFVLKHCRQLEMLMVSDRFSFCPESYHAHEWRQLRMLMVTTYVPQSELYPWHAWSNIPSIFTCFLGVGANTAALEHLSGPLRLLVDIEVIRERPNGRTEGFRLSATTNDHDCDDFHLASAGTHFWRALSGPMPMPPPDSAQDGVPYTGGLLAVAACAARFVRMTLPLVHWDRFVAYVPRLPALQHLRLMLPVDECPRSTRHRWPLECPALARVLLAPRKAVPAVTLCVKLNDFAVFFAGCVRGVLNPMELRLERGIEAAPVPCDENFKRVFRSAEYTKISREGLVAVRLE